jgi:hypothetical protein
MVRPIPANLRIILIRGLVLEIGDLFLFELSGGRLFSRECV